MRGKNGIPITLKEFINQYEHKDKIHKLGDSIDFIMKCIEVQKDFETYFYKNHCAICDKQLSFDELSLLSRKDFIITCEVHSQYRNDFQTDLIREELNIPKRKTVYEL